MKYLFVIAHADTTGTSTSHSLAKSAETFLKSNGHEVRVVDLVKAGFKECGSPDDFVDPKKSGERFSYSGLQHNRDNLSPLIREQQENLLWCDYFVVFGPMWFYRLPACFSSYIERVFTGGWAYNFDVTRDKLPLHGTKALIVITTGGSKDYYEHLKGITSLDALLYFTTYGLNGCGMDVLRSQGIFSAPLDQEKLKLQGELLNKALLKLDKRPILPFGTKAEGNDELATFMELPNISLEDAANA